MGWFDSNVIKRDKLSYRKCNICGNLRLAEVETCPCLYECGG